MEILIRRQILWKLPSELHRHLPAGSPVNFARDIAGLIASQKDKDWGELGRLSGSPEYRLRAELFHLLFRHRGGNRGVQTGPGATALTRTPFFIARLASDRVKLTIAALVDA